MSVLPAPADTGIIFRRTDLGGACVRALAENVSRTARSTTISEGEASVVTVEHVLSALTGLGIDNAFIELDAPEVPILDGSALPYVRAFEQAGIATLDSPRRYVTLDAPVTVSSERTGSVIKIEPSDHFEVSIDVDFDSKVLGHQQAGWGGDEDGYRTQVAPCRTFVFYHDIEPLVRQGLVKGGDIDNAIIIMERPVPQEDIDSLCALLGLPSYKVADNGYLDNLRLHFPDECGRHKLLDIIGDLRLCGGFLKARVTATRPGHTINTTAAKAIRQAINIG